MQFEDIENGEDLATGIIAAARHDLWECGKWLLNRKDATSKITFRTAVRIKDFEECQYFFLTSCNHMVTMDGRECLRNATRDYYSRADMIEKVVKDKKISVRPLQILSGLSFEDAVQQIVSENTYKSGWVEALADMCGMTAEEFWKATEPYTDILDIDAVEDAITELEARKEEQDKNNKEKAKKRASAFYGDKKAEFEKLKKLNEQEVLQNGTGTDD